MYSRTYHVCAYLSKNAMLGLLLQKDYRDVVRVVWTIICDSPHLLNLM